MYSQVNQKEICKENGDSDSNISLFDFQKSNNSSRSLPSHNFGFGFDRISPIFNNKKENLKKNGFLGNSYIKYPKKNDISYLITEFFAYQAREALQDDKIKIPKVTVEIDKENKPFLKIEKIIGLQTLKEVKQLDYEKYAPILTNSLIYGGFFNGDCDRHLKNSGIDCDGKFWDYDFDLAYDLNKNNTTAAQDIAEIADTCKQGFPLGLNLNKEELKRSLSNLFSKKDDLIKIIFDKLDKAKEELLNKLGTGYIQDITARHEHAKSFIGKQFAKLANLDNFSAELKIIPLPPKIKYDFNLVEMPKSKKRTTDFLNSCAADSKKIKLPFFNHTDNDKKSNTTNLVDLVDKKDLKNIKISFVEPKELNEKTKVVHVFNSVFSRN